MSKSKLTLIVDGNWLLMSRFSVLTDKYANENELANELKLLMGKSISIVLNTFPLIDNIIFVSDGGSWRGDVERPSFLQAEYKGNRELDDSINWDVIFGAYADFMNTLQASGITVCKESGVEGDDWCWHWSNKLNSEGTNCMIWSRDKDLTQLVKRDGDGCFTVCWNKDSGVTELDINEEDMDFFFNMNYSDNDLILKDIETKSISTNKINPKSVVVDKIFRGDSGDNVFPAVLRKAKAEGSDKKFRISVKDMDYDLDIDDDNAVEGYVDSILEAKLYKDRVEHTKSQILEHIRYNKKLVYLNRDSYPQEILDILSQYSEYNLSNRLSDALFVFESDKHGISEDVADDIIDELF